MFFRNLFFLLFFITSFCRSDFVWSECSSGSFENHINWDGHISPTTNSTIVLPSCDDEYIVTISFPINLHSLHLGSNSIVLALCDCLVFFDLDGDGILISDNLIDWSNTSNTPNSLLSFDISFNLNFIGESDNILLSNIELILFNIFNLNSNGIFYGYSGAIITLEDSSLVLFSQESVWQAHPSVLSHLPLLYIPSPDYVLHVAKSFEIGWNITSRGVISVTDSSILTASGSGVFFSEVELCTTCEINFFTGIYSFLPTSVLLGINGNIDAKYLIGKDSLVLFEGIFLLNPVILIESGFLHFMHGSVYNISSVTVKLGGGIQFSQCPASGNFELSHLHVQGDVTFSNIPCNISVDSLIVSDGELNFTNFSGNLMLRKMELVGGSIIFDSLSVPLDLNSLSINGSKVIFNSGWDVVLSNFSIFGSSIISGIDLVFITDNFLFHGGSLQDINMSALENCSSVLTSSYPKSIIQASITLDYIVVFENNCFVEFGSNSLLNISNNSILTIFDSVYFTTIDDSIVNHNLYLGGIVYFEFSYSIFDVFVTYNALGFANTTSLVLSRGSNWYSSIIFDGISAYTIRDEGIFIFYQGSLLEGSDCFFTVDSSHKFNFTALEEPIPPQSFTNLAVYFSGNLYLNPAVEISYGFVQFEPVSSFTINHLSVLFPSSVIFIGSQGPLWQLYSLFITGRLEISQNQRSLEVFTYNIYGIFAESLWTDVHVDSIFHEIITIDQGSLTLFEFSNVYFPEVLLLNATLSTFHVEFFEIGIISSYFSEIYLTENSNSIKIGDFVLECSLLDASTANEFLVEILTCFESTFTGFDHIFVSNHFYFYSGIVDLKISVQFLTLTKDLEKILLPFSSLSVLTTGIFESGTLVGHYLSSFSIANYAIFNIIDGSFFYPNSTSPFTFHNAPKLIVNGILNQDSNDFLLQVSFEFIVNPFGTFNLVSGKMILLAGGVSRGSINVSPGAELILSAYRTKFGYRFAYQKFELAVNSISDIQGQLSVFIYSTLKVFGHLILSDHIFSTGLIYFGKFSTLDVGSFTCTQQCITIFDNLVDPLSINSLTVSNGAYVSLRNFASTATTSLGAVQVTDAVIDFSTNTLVNVSDLSLDKGIIEGSDTVNIVSSFDFYSGRLGSYMLNQAMRDVHVLTISTLIDSVSRIFHQFPKHFHLRSSLINNGKMSLLNPTWFVAYPNASIINNGEFNHGDYCSDVLCSSLNNFVYTVMDVNRTSMNFIPRFINNGVYRKTKGTGLLTNQMYLIQSNSGLFLHESSVFRQFLGNAQLDGQHEYSDNVVFDVHNSTVTTISSSVFDGLQGRFRTNVDGIVFWNGRYNLTHNFVHDVANFTFTKLADIDLTRVTVNSGFLIFEEGKDRTEHFYLSNLIVNDGYLGISNVPQHFIIDDYFQTGGSIVVQNVNNYFTIGKCSVEDGSSLIDNVLLNITFIELVNNLAGSFTLKNLQEWLNFMGGLSIGTSHSLTVHTVLKTVFTPKSFTLRGTVTFTNLRNLLIIERFNVHGGTTIIQDVLTTVEIFDGIFATRGSTTFRSVHGETFVRTLNVVSPAVLLKETIQVLTIVDDIYASGKLTVRNYRLCNVPLAHFDAPADVLFENGVEYFNISSKLSGSGGDVVFRSLPLFITNSFEPWGANFLWHVITQNWIVPSFHIKSGSIVELRTFSFNPKLYDIQIWQGFLRLNSAKVPGIDHLLMRGGVSSSNPAVRDGGDTAIVHNGIDWKSGRFGTLNQNPIGKTISSVPMSVTTRDYKELVMHTLQSDDVTTIDIATGSEPTVSFSNIYGRNSGLWIFKKPVTVLGDVWFRGTIETPNELFPIIQIDESILLEKHPNFVTLRRFVDWTFNAKPSTIVDVQDFELALGRGGGTIETNITLCPTCILAFRSDLTGNRRTNHSFTSIGGISCPTCELDLRTNGAWVRMAGVVELKKKHVQNHGRLELLATSRHPFNEFILNNCDVHVIGATYYNEDHDDLADNSLFTYSHVVLNLCGRLSHRSSRYQLEFLDSKLTINGGLLDVNQHSRPLLIPELTITNGGGITLTTFTYPWSTTRLFIEYGYLNFSTGHEVTLDLIEMKVPIENPSGNCFSEIGHFRSTTPRYTLSRIAGSDTLKLTDFDWLGGTVGNRQLDVLNSVNSNNALERGIQNGVYLNIHNEALIGGIRDVWVDDESELNIMSDATASFVSSVNFVPSNTGRKRSVLNNHGTLDFPVPNTNVMLAFDVFQHNLLNATTGVSVTYNGQSTSSGHYILDHESKLLLRQYNHLFTSSMTSIGGSSGAGSIHMDGWNWVANFIQDPNWLHLVTFYGRWEISQSFIQDNGRWLFAQNAYVDISHVYLHERAHITVDKARPITGEWNFDVLHISAHSYWNFVEIQDDVIVKEFIMKSNDFVSFGQTDFPISFNHIELYDGTSTFSTTHPLNLKYLLVNGGILQGTDVINTDVFIFKCGEIGDNIRINVRERAEILTCSKHVDSTNIVHKRIRNNVIISVFPSGTMLYNSVRNNGISPEFEFLNNARMEVFGESTLFNMYPSAHVTLAPVDHTRNRITFYGSTRAIGQHERTWDIYIEIRGEFHLEEGVVITRRYLDVYDEFVLYNSAQILFARNATTPGHLVTFHSTANFREVLTIPGSIPQFRPASRYITVNIRCPFQLTRLQYSTGTISFTGPTSLDVTEIHLSGGCGIDTRAAFLHFIELQNELDSVRGFTLEGCSEMYFDTQLGKPIIFDGFGVLRDYAKIRGVTGNDIIIDASVNPNSDTRGSFEWQGGGFSGNMTVHVYNSLEITGVPTKFMEKGVEVYFYNEVVFSSAGRFDLLDDSKLIITETGHLLFSSGSLFSQNDIGKCNFDSWYIGGDSYSQLINYGSLSINSNLFSLEVTLINFGQLLLNSEDVSIFSSLINHYTITVSNSTVITIHGKLQSTSFVEIFGTLLFTETSNSQFSGFLSLADNSNFSLLGGSHNFIDLTVDNPNSPIIFNSSQCYSSSTNNSHLFLDSSSWPYCDSILSIKDSAIDTFTGISGRLVIEDSNVIFSTLSIHNLFVLHIADNASVFVTDHYTRQSYYYPQGLLTGYGQIFFPTGNATNDLIGSQCIYAHFGRDCSVSCNFFNLCSLCVEFVECGWSNNSSTVENGSCLVATFDGHPLDDSSQDFYYGDCSVCDGLLVLNPSDDNLEIYSNLQTTLSFTFDVGVLSFSATLPYVRSMDTSLGITWVVDVSPFSNSIPFSELIPSSCENRDWKRLPVDSSLYSLSAPSALMSGALEQSRYPSYFFGNNWNSQPLSCNAIQLSRSFNLNELISCTSRLNSSFITSLPFYETPLFDTSGSLYASLVSPSNSLHSPSSVMFTNQRDFVVQYVLLQTNTTLLRCNSNNICSVFHSEDYSLEISSVVFTREEDLVNLNITILSFSTDSFKLEFNNSKCIDSAATLDHIHTHSLGTNHYISCSVQQFPFDFEGEYSSTFSIMNCPRTGPCITSGNQLTISTILQVHSLPSYDEILESALRVYIGSYENFTQADLNFNDVSSFTKPGPYTPGEELVIVPYHHSSSVNNNTFTPLTVVLCTTDVSFSSCDNSSSSWVLIEEGQLNTNSLLKPRLLGSSSFGDLLSFNTPVLTRSSLILIQTKLQEQNSDCLTDLDFSFVSSFIYVVASYSNKLERPGSDLFPWTTVLLLLLILVVVFTLLSCIRRCVIRRNKGKIGIQKTPDTVSKPLEGLSSINNFERDVEVLPSTDDPEVVEMKKPITAESLLSAFKILKDINQPAQSEGPFMILEDNEVTSFQPIDSLSKAPNDLIKLPTLPSLSKKLPPLKGDNSSPLPSDPSLKSFTKPLAIPALSIPNVSTTTLPPLKNLNELPSTSLPSLTNMMPLKRAPKLP
ncbi:hypothetical protein RCL1_000269 [Eukaryota sp. TZLM3-RCL]